MVRAFRKCATISGAMPAKFGSSIALPRGISQTCRRVFFKAFSNQCASSLLHKILAEARAAKAMPWDAKRAALYRTIFPQMTGCLPEDEGAQLRFDFETELARLEAA